MPDIENFIEVIKRKEGKNGKKDEWEEEEK